MAKYLTPARISTLLLIELYRRQPFWTYLPETSNTILRVIAQQCLQPATDDLALPSSTYHDPPNDVLAFARQLANLDSHIPGRPWLSIFLHEAWTLKTVDELHDLLRSCSALLALTTTNDDQPCDLQANAITRASQIGQFIRRCCVEYTRLQFSDTLLLWKSFTRFREPSRAVWTQLFPDAALRHSQLEADDASASISDMHLSNPQTSLVSTDSIEAVLTASVTQLQKLGQRVPADVKAKLEKWVIQQQSNGLQSLRNFMVFFDAWRAGQYNLALENLHRYFDYAVAKGPDDEMKTHYQYALLHLSVLHADFEHWEESVNAMRECIATARENQDASCLNFALSWLMYLRQSRHMRASSGLHALAAVAGEGGNEQDELAFLKTKAREGKHWTLLSSTLLEEARFEMRHRGVSAKSLELVLQSSYLNAQHGLQALMPATGILNAATFDRLGQSHLARQLHHITLSTRTANISLGDRSRVVCRLAYDAAQRGQYTQSIAMLQELKHTVRGTLKLESRVIGFAEVVGLMRAIRRSDLHAARYHMANLRPVRSNADTDFAAPIEQLELQLLIKQGRLDAAHDKLGSHIKQARSNGNDVAESLILLIQKANLFAAAGYALKGFSITLRAIAGAQEYRLIGPLVEALTSLARILNELGEFEAAKSVTQAALPHAVEMSNTSVTAQLFVILGEAHVGLAAAVDHASQTKFLQLLRTASAYIERGRIEYAKIQEHNSQLECLLMKSHLANCTGDEATAEHADGMYHQLMMDHEESYG